MLASRTIVPPRLVTSSECHIKFCPNLVVRVHVFAERLDKMAAEVAKFSKVRTSHKRTLRVMFKLSM